MGNSGPSPTPKPRAATIR